MGVAEQGKEVQEEALLVHESVPQSNFTCFLGRKQKTGKTRYRLNTFTSFQERN